MSDLDRFTLALAGILALFALLQLARSSDRLAGRLLVAAFALLLSDD